MLAAASDQPPDLGGGEVNALRDLVVHAAELAWPRREHAAQVWSALASTRRKRCQPSRACALQSTAQKASTATVPPRALRKELQKAGMDWSRGGGAKMGRNPAD